MSDSASPAALLDVREACRQLGGIGRTRFYELVNGGEVRTVRIGRRRFVPAGAIAEYVARLEARDEGGAGDTLMPAGPAVPNSTR